MSISLEKIWAEYSRGLEYLTNINLFSRVETCHDFVNGDQWKGLKYTGERPPRLNVLFPMMKSSTAMVGQNSLNIEYTSLNYGPGRENLVSACNLLTYNAATLWEQLKMDKLMWDVLQDAYIAGDSFLYFYDDDSKNRGRILCEQIDTTRVMLADESQPDIQKQPYILLIRRMPVDTVRKQARQLGLTREQAEEIMPDEESAGADRAENKRNGDKVTVVARLWKEGGCVHITRVTKTHILQPDTAIIGLTLYPIAKYSWKPRKGFARGDGDVWDKIPNQISINKSLYRLEQAVKTASYPIKVYRQNAINPAAVARLSRPGASIALQGSADMPVTNVISYLSPAAISPYAASYWQDLINLTRNLSGTGDNLENINPEQASGAAIQAVMEAKNLNVNMQLASYRQFAEDIAAIWLELFMVYNPGGLSVPVDDADENGSYVRFIPADVLRRLDVYIKIDALPSSATRRAAKDARLKEMLEKGLITFSEYVQSLSDDSNMPVEAFRKIDAQRKRQAFYENEEPKLPVTEEPGQMLAVQEG